MFFEKKTQEYKSNNNKLGNTLDPIVGPMLMMQSTTIILFETGIYTIVPIIENNTYVQSGFNMCLDVYLRACILFIFIVNYISECISEDNYQLVKKNTITNCEKISTIFLYLLDKIYKTRQKELDEYLNVNNNEEVYHEANIVSEEEEEELNRNYGD